jgi:hypothetical protein
MKLWKLFFGDRAKESLLTRYTLWVIAKYPWQACNISGYGVRWLAAVYDKKGIKPGDVLEFEEDKYEIREVVEDKMRLGNGTHLVLELAKIEGMKYEHNQICTKDGVVSVGQQYTYKEDFYVAEVKVLEDASDSKGIGFKLEVLKENVDSGNKTFDVWAAVGHYAYSGMWRLYDLGTYMVGGEDVRKT